jgi:hypothetical protein
MHHVHQNHINQMPMSQNPSVNPYHQIPYVLFLFGKMLVIGTYLVFFLTTYLTFEQSYFGLRFDVYIKWIPYLILISIISGLPLIIYQKLVSQKWQLSNSLLMPFFSKRKEIHFLFGIEILWIIIILSVKFNVSFEVLHFITFIYSLLFILRIAYRLTIITDQPSWQHPTTAGSVVEGTFALGICMSLILFIEKNLQSIYEWLLLIILVLEGLTIWGRFKFLSTKNAETRRTIQMMLGSYLTLFGVRFIFGIVMPVVYIMWTLLIRDLPPHPLLLMILVGELSERILFFITAQPN